MRAKSERNTASRAVILSRLETIWANQSGAPATSARIRPFARTKIWSRKPLTLRGRKAGSDFLSKTGMGLGPTNFVSLPGASRYCSSRDDNRPGVKNDFCGLVRRVRFRPAHQTKLYD